MTINQCVEEMNMVLVDTSVIIDSLRKKENKKTILFNKLYEAKTPLLHNDHDFDYIAKKITDLNIWE
jgi:predicted nucleic acid-binding protein